MTRFCRATIAWARRHEYLAATAVFGAALCVYFFPLLLGEQLGQSNLLYQSFPWAGDRPPGLELAPRGTDGDIAFLFHPLLTVAREQVHAGQVPLWNPYSYGGTALLGDLETAVFFPLTWVAFVLSVDAAWGLIAALKMLAAGLGTYALARQLGVPRRGALLAGMVYMLSAPTVGWIQWSLGTVAALFPWLLLTSERLYRRPDGRRVAELAVVVSLTILAGHPETAWMASSAAAVYLAVLLVVARRRAGAAAPRPMRVALGWLAGNVLGFGLSAIALVPFFQAFADSITREEHSNYFAGARLPRLSALTYLMPNVFGDERVYHEPHSDWNQTAAYVGVTVLLLALAGLVRGGRDARVISLSVTAGLALCAAYGIPPVSWVLDALPPFDGIITFKVLWIPALALALGAGAGFATLQVRPLEGRQVAMLVAAAAGVAAVLLAASAATGHLPAPAGVERGAVLRFALALGAGAVVLLAVGRLRPLTALAVVVAVCIADLAYLRDVNVTLPPESAHPASTPALRYLARQARPMRVSSDYVFFFAPVVLPPNTSALHGLESVTGYDFPLSKRWADLSTEVWGQKGNTPEHSYTSPRTRGASLTALRMMNTRYYMAAPGSKPLNADFETVYRGRDAVVYRDPRALPRAYVVGRTRPLSYDATVEALANGRLDPREEALVPPDAEVLSTPGGFRSVREEEVDPQHIRVDVPPGPGGWLVLADAYAPQWKAEVDGDAAELRPTNLAAMGLRLAPGAHTVEVRYSHAGFVAGAALSAAFALITVLLWLLAPDARVATRSSSPD